jgi:hypothetical protein
VTRYTAAIMTLHSGNLLRTFPKGKKYSRREETRSVGTVTSPRQLKLLYGGRSVGTVTSSRQFVVIHYSISVRCSHGFWNKVLNSLCMTWEVSAAGVYSTVMQLFHV